MTESPPVDVRFEGTVDLEARKISLTITSSCDVIAAVTMGIPTAGMSLDNAERLATDQMTAIDAICQELPKALTRAAGLARDALLASPAEGGTDG